MNIIRDNKLVARYFNIPVDEIKAAKVRFSQITISALEESRK